MFPEGFPTVVVVFDHGHYSYTYLVAHPTARKWDITPVINGISRVNPLIIGVITHLLSEMSHQVFIYIWLMYG